MSIKPDIEPFIPKKHITLRVDPEIVEYYRSTGPRRQSRINHDLAHLLVARRAAGVAGKPRRRGAR